jgi:RNA polymerase sigma-70 factor (sigma-E family)
VGESLVTNQAVVTPADQGRSWPLRGGGMAKMGTMAFRPRSARSTGVGVDDPLTVLHREQYRSLVRLANLLLDDRGRSEEIVQDAFVKLQLRWGGLRRLDRAPAYLRSAVLNGARSALRHGRVVGRHAERRTALPDMPTPETGALAAVEHDRVVAAMRLLPTRQREALALRYYLDLSERDMAAAMGVSAGSVKTHLRRGLAALAGLLGEEKAENAEKAEHPPGDAEPAPPDDPGNTTSDTTNDTTTSPEGEG